MLFYNENANIQFDLKPKKNTICPQQHCPVNINTYSTLLFALKQEEGDKQKVQNKHKYIYIMREKANAHVAESKDVVL